MNLHEAIIAAIRCYIGITENDRSQYRPETMRHLTTLMEASFARPEEWGPLREWVDHNFEGSNLEYMTNLMPTAKKGKKNASSTEENVSS